MASPKHHPPTEFDPAIAPAKSDEPLAGSSRGWAAGAIWTAAAFLLLFNAASVDSWASMLAPNGFTAPLRGYADAWLDRTASWKLGAPRDLVRGLWDQALAAPAPRVGSVRRQAASAAVRSQR